MRLIEQRQTVIGPGAIVRMKKTAAASLKDLMVRWRVLGVDEEVVRVEDVEDPEDVCTLSLEQIERVSGGPEELQSLISGEESSYLLCPEHNKWPACMDGDHSLIESLEDGEYSDEYGSLFDALSVEEEDEDE